ncbi:hypothetical protein RFI_18650, partial [Reticulomyxa filosa]
PLISPQLSNHSSNETRANKGKASAKEATEKNVGTTRPTKRQSKEQRAPPVHSLTSTSNVTYTPRILELTQLGFSRAETPAHIVERSDNDDENMLVISLSDSVEKDGNENSTDQLKILSQYSSSKRPAHSRHHTVGKDHDIEDSYHYGYRTNDSQANSNGTNTHIHNHGSHRRHHKHKTKSKHNSDTIENNSNSIYSMLHSMQRDLSDHTHSVDSTQPKRKSTGNLTLDNSGTYDLSGGDADRKELKERMKLATAVETWNQYIDRDEYIKQKYPTQYRDRHKAWSQWTQQLDKAEKDSHMLLSASLSL